MRIDAYNFGKIDIEGTSYTSDVIVFADRVRDGWWRKEGHRLYIEDLADITAAKPDFLVVGTGYYGRMSIPEKTRKSLEAQGISLIEARTGEAVQAFRRLQREAARVVAALHLTC
jgi:hypothetical protein